ncbi:MAG: hypothetical protein JSS97_02275 [Actinobacteria bacterium]|nr:hypothetical protein [Actinomycetota bacterium]
MGSRPGRSRSGCGRAERSSGGPRRRPGRSAAVAAAVEWWNGTANCEARFVGRLTSAEGIAVTHDPPDCGGSGRLAGAAAGR